MDANLSLSCKPIALLLACHHRQICGCEYDLPPFLDSESIFFLKHVPYYDVKMMCSGIYN